MRGPVALAVAVFAVCGATAIGSAQVGAPVERFVLSGLVVSDGGEGVAWLEEPNLTQGRVVALRRGGNLGPWTLTRILEDRVELEGPAGKVFVPVSNAGSGTVASALSPTGAGHTPVARPTAPGVQLLSPQGISATPPVVPGNQQAPAADRASRASVGPEPSRAIVQSGPASARSDSNAKASEDVGTESLAAIRARNLAEFRERTKNDIRQLFGVRRGNR